MPPQFGFGCCGVYFQQTPPCQSADQRASPKADWIVCGRRKPPPCSTSIAIQASLLRTPAAARLLSVAYWEVSETRGWRHVLNGYRGPCRGASSAFHVIQRYVIYLECTQSALSHRRPAGHRDGPDHETATSVVSSSNTGPVRRLSRSRDFLQDTRLVSTGQQGRESQRPHGVSPLSCTHQPMGTRPISVANRLLAGTRQVTCPSEAAPQLSTQPRPVRADALSRCVVRARSPAPRNRTCSDAPRVQTHRTRSD